MKENVQDVEAIAAKVLWYLRLESKELMAFLAANREESFHYIPNPTKGMVFIGSEGTARFRAIARRFLKNNAANRRRTDREVFLGHLKAEFLRRFVQQGEAIDGDRVQRMVSAAFLVTEAGFGARRQFIPCAIYLSEKFQEFAIGPVKFRQTPRFLEIYGADLEAHRTRGKPAASTEETATPKKANQTLHGMLVDRVRAHFGDYGWVAEMDVPPCAPKVSYSHALSVTRAALNVLKLIVGRQYSYRIRTSEDRGHAPNSAKLARGAAGGFEISAVYSSDQNVLGDECLEALFTEFTEDLRQANVVLERAAAFDDPPPLCQRFLDALSWYGDAVNEPSAASRIVKFVTAIEAMCGTGPERDSAGKEIRGVTEIVTTRAGIWLQRWIGGTQAAAREQVSAIYGWRSDLVHGSESPLGEEVVENSVTTEEATRRILLTGLDYFTHLGMIDAGLTIRPLREKFRQLEQDAKDREVVDSPGTD